MIGEKLGAFHLVEKIGNGSMGTVYRAVDSGSARVVAVKIVRANVLYDAERRERFLRGLLTASQIRHQSICPILEIGDNEDDFFIVMPFLEGETLAQRRKRGFLPWRRTLELGIAVGEALGAVHDAGEVHRALSPANIWIRPDGTVVLTDCCVSRFTELDADGELSSVQPRQEDADTIIPMSALAYMSPEQVRGQMVDHRSDIFALGAILYEALCDRHPFEARNSLSRISAILDADPAPLKSRKHVLPALLDGILRKALAGNRNDRYSNTDEFVAALRSVLAGNGSSDNASEKLQMRAARRGAPLKLAGLSILILLALAIAAYLFLSR